MPSDTADAKMRMFNLDGSEGMMCGNAIRCVAKYLYDNGIVHTLTMRIETPGGIKELNLSTTDGSVSSVKVNMGCAELNPAKIPVSLYGESVIAPRVCIDGKEYQITCVSMGNPHAVVFCDSIDALELHEIGPLFENNELFPDRINTEFIEIVGKNHLKMRLWKRGSCETLACGTGACAAAAAAIPNDYCDKNTDIRVGLLGGELVINYNGEDVSMTGECQKVFDGAMEI